MTLMRGWGLMDEDPATEIARLYPAVKPDAVHAEAWRENLATCWIGRLDIIDANDQHMR
jgi:hypothetical protein